MFVIFGTPRSGTTIFAETLNSHPDITIPHETDFIVPMVFIYTRIQEPELGREMIANLITNSSAFKSSIGEYLSIQRVRQVVYESEYRAAAILNNLYAAIATSSEAKIAGDKSPNDLDYAKILVETKSLSDFKILHLVRDVRDVMVSLNRTGWLPDGGDYFPRFWCNNNLYLHTKFHNHPDRYLLVRYEDMVNDPESTFRQVCSYLDISYSNSILSPDMRPKRYPDRLNLQKEIYRERIGIYKGNLEAAEIANYEQQASECLQAFGYVLVTQNVSSPQGSLEENILIKDIPCSNRYRLTITENQVIIHRAGQSQPGTQQRNIQLAQISSLEFHPTPFWRSPWLEIQHQIPGGTLTRDQVQFGNFITRFRYQLMTGFSPGKVYQMLINQIKVQQ